MNEFIDIYCERTGPDFWGEPLNALSNLAFFVAAFFAYKLARSQSGGAPKPAHGLLITLLLAIGTGSTLFHTFAQRWAMLADTLPILLFQMAFLLIYARRVIRLGMVQTAGLFGLFVLSIAGFGSLPGHWLNGSIGYAPALLFLGGLGLYHYLSQQEKRYALLMAAGIFAVSLTFRSIDMYVCEALPVGVHYLWHILNACVLYLSLAGLFAAAKPHQ